MAFYVFIVVVNVAYNNFWETLLSRFYENGLKTL